MKKKNLIILLLIPFLIALLGVVTLNTTFNFIDNDIFHHDELEYFIKNHKDEILSEHVKIRPKDYLINMLNNTISSGKYKWFI